LFAEPGGKPWGWIVNGWIADLTHPGEVPAPLGTTGLVETAYETATFIVLEARDDGWLRFRYARPDSTGPDGTAWTPACALSLGAVAIRYQPWSERLMQTEIGPLHARDERLPTTLYAEPTPDAPVRATLTGFDYHLEPLEIRGDWMRVRLKQPSDYCGEPETPPAVTEGWIRWWSSERGPLVWYYTRGC
jgi:hypothetical protein